MTLAEDKSWRVRWSVASKIDELCAAFGKESTSTAIIFALEKLLKVRDPLCCRGGPWHRCLSFYIELISRR